MTPNPPQPAPLVTVITPAYNASATLVAAVESALGQTFGDLEVIVVDDGSTEPSADVVRDLNDRRLRVIRTEANRGVSAARNTAVAAARGAVLAQLDADDLWRPDHLEGLLPALTNPAVGLAYSNAAIIGTPLLDRAIAVRTTGDGLPDWISDRALHPVDDLADLYRVNPIPSPAAIMRTQAVRAVGGYPTWLTVGEDYYLYIKLRRAGWHFAYVDAMSAVYRWPEPHRGVSFDARGGARQTFKLFVVLTARSPGERVLWARLGGEAVRLLETHVPGSVPVGRRVKRVLATARTRRRDPLPP